MYTLHLKRGFHHTDIRWWNEAASGIKRLVHNPEFWIITGITALLLLLIVLAVMQGNVGPNNNPYPLRQSYFPYF